MDGRSKNSGTKGNNGGRPSKADELKAMQLGQDAIIKEYGSISNYWSFIATKSKESLPHLKLIHEYVYGLPKQNVDLTSGGETIIINLGNGKDPSKTTD